MPVINKMLTLKDLPLPPSDKTGWPWTEESKLVPEQISKGDEWPRISVVTPSYNYGEFIEETIRSVLLQGYPNLEYIIIDGGSTDNTVDIIKKYEKYLTYWVSSSDEGQTDALNKGYQYCTGDIFAWLNADDTYTKMTLHRVAENYLKGYQLIAGSCLAVYSDGREEIIDSKLVDFERYLKYWLRGACFPQPSIFVDTNITNNCFPLEKKLYMLMDYQYFLRVLSHNPKAISINQTWVIFKFHGANKTLSNYRGGLSEFVIIASSESKKLSLIKRFLFLVSLKDYITLHPLLDNSISPNLRQIMIALCSRLTLLRWLIFWKLLMKTIVGKKIYSLIKNIREVFA